MTRAHARPRSLAAGAGHLELTNWRRAPIGVDVASVVPEFSADVDRDDLAQWQDDVGENALSDADNDGDSDGADFLGWQQQFGSGMPAAASAVKFVPEPSALAVISLGGCGLALVHRRHR
jgi:hypothetical protein